MIDRTPSYTNITGVTHDDEVVQFNVEEIVEACDVSFTGWECNAGIEHFHIDQQGELYRGVCKQGGSLGNIHGEYTLPDTPIICAKQECWCTTDIRTSKRRIDNETKHTN